MMEALKKIGECVLKREFGLPEITEKFWLNDVYNSTYLISEEVFNYDYYEKNIENPLEKPHVIYINFNSSQNEFSLGQVEIEEALSVNNDDWIKKEAVGGQYFSPSVPLDISFKKETVIKKLKGTIGTLMKTMDIGKSKKAKKLYPNNIKEKLQKINEELKENTNEIAEKIWQILENHFINNKISKNKVNILVSLKIDGNTIKEDNELSRYLFHKFIIKTLKIEDVFQNNGQISWKDENSKLYCSICSQKEGFITIDYKPYTFFSNDKPSYNTQSFLSTSGEMFPLDIKCAYLIEIGRCYVDKNFEFNISYEKFKIIPKILFPINSKVEMSILNLKANYESIMKRESRNRRITQEEYLFYALEDFNNTINFDMIFYEKNQSEFKILLHIKDITPSRIKEIHSAFESARRMGNKLNRNFGNLLSFYTIKRFFSRFEGNSISYDLEGFYEMLDIIFSGKIADKFSLLTLLYQNLKNKIFKSQERPSKSLQTEIHASLLIFQFLKELNQLKW